MNEPDIRWIQRFANFERAFLLLGSAIAIESPSVVERAGLIQFFEMAFELSWKLLKDYEQREGFTAKTPREVIKQAFQAGLINNGHDWIEALQDRNLTYIPIKKMSLSRLRKAFGIGTFRYYKFYMKRSKRNWRLMNNALRTQG
jgi:nucleotidyltransferase substrate binding protein (TIGR01987 family)